jgi:hypothetical protein
LTGDGAVELAAGDRPGAAVIPAPAILDAAGRPITPAGLGWSLRRGGSSWWLELRLDDRRLPLPYVIDPAIVFRGAAATGNGGATTLSIAKPAGVVAGDVLVAQIAVRGGTGTTITAPGGWTSVRRENRLTTIAQAIYYRVAGTLEPTSGWPASLRCRAETARPTGSSYPRL